MNKWTHVQMDKWTDEQIGGQINRQIDKISDCQNDGWID